VPNPIEFKRVSCPRAGIVFLLLSSARPATAAGVEDFYKGRNVSIIIGYSVGGGYDTYARMLSRYLGDHIPGRPKRGAAEHAGRRQRQGGQLYLWGGAPRTAAPSPPSVARFAVAPLLAAAGAAFDGTKFAWLGSISKDTSLCITSAKSEIKTWDDFLAKPSTLGGEGRGGGSGRIRPSVQERLRREVQAGHRLSGDQRTVALAMERREIDGFLRTVLEHPEEPPSRLAQQQVDQHHRPGRPEEGAGAAGHSVRHRPRPEPKEQHQIVKLVLVSQEMARPFAAPPGLPADRRAALLAAFDQTMKDPAFLAEAKVQDLDIDPVSAKDIDALLAEVYATPKEHHRKGRQSHDGGNSNLLRTCPGAQRSTSKARDRKYKSCHR